MSGSELSLSGLPSSPPPVLRIDDQRDVCAITLFVVGMLVIIAAVSVGIAGLMNAISLGRAASLTILIVGSIIGSAPIIFGIYKKAIYNFISGLPSATDHNNKSKAQVECIRTGIKYSEGYATVSQASIIKPGWREQVVFEFTVTRLNVDSFCDVINRTIDDYSKRSIIVSVHADGTINHDSGEIIVSLVTLVKE